MSDREIQLHAALRTALARFIDPDDDTMPAPNRIDGGFTRVPTDTVIDELITAITTSSRQKFPITSHPYQGFGYEAPCTATGYGTACGESEYDHEELP
ncbi:hypothetical protein [Streptomyces pacificus]|uniref:Uncharacterized protein n=1 Tax=Streptomyces pacificus TaxID=2705029 RepID=A0A6A0B2E9_9ACTN|nr:hypothetical protein [Streptomyces pacificus]GFH38885.1 hypothetical protein SCWH03_51480 [Streptomyces pacificus]